MSKQKNVIYDTFKNADLSSRTKIAYINRLMLIDPNKGTAGINYFTDSDEVMSELSNMSINSKKGTLAAILSLFKYYNKTTKKITKAQTVYKNELTKINKKISSESNILSLENKDNWVSKEEIKSKLNSYGRKFRKLIKTEPKMLTNDEYKTILEYVILCLYTMTAPRRERDYYLMLISNENLDNDDNPYNMLDLEKKQFIFRDFKDKKALGTQIIDIPDKLFKIIKDYVDIVQERFQIKDDKLVKFLVKPTGRFILRGDIRTYLSNVFGKKVGATSMRRTFATEKYGDLKKDANDMGTSVSQIRNHYIKENVDD
jgi:integrase